MSDAQKAAARAKVSAAAANLAAAMQELRDSEPDLITKYETQDVLAHEAADVAWKISYETAQPRDIDY
ncbi:hypothetical protein ACFOY2_17860 [Nonomuraea purpurea]|uniref:Uncharacterized protein n=1 Tax=Nonomuraea purpurea TaxID=1849276 RepID=A0ABV8G5V6_9ACTN